MLDKPEKTRELVATLKAALPFEVALMPDVITHLAGQQNPVTVKPTEAVSDISYAGDEGGILCHIHPADADNMLIVGATDGQQELLSGRTIGGLDDGMGGHAERCASFTPVCKPSPWYEGPTSSIQCRCYA